LGLSVEKSMAIDDHLLSGRKFAAMLAVLDKVCYALSDKIIDMGDVLL